MNNRTPITAYKAVVKAVGEIRSEDRIPPGEMWVIKETDGAVHAVDFLCPCGCGSECYTPVCRPEDKKPNSRVWGFDEATLTITPSIRYTGGCKAHFNVTNGRVVVHPDSGK